MFNRLIAWALHNRLIVLAATVALFFAGVVSLERMPVDVFPEFAPPQVIIQTEVPGMAPTDVESLVTYPLESAINGSPGVMAVRSKTSIGLSTITVVFASGTDIYLDRQLVNERLQDAAGRLPATAKPPVMLPVTSAVGWLVKYALTSDTVSPQELRTLSDWTIAPRLLSLGGVASVVSIGGEVKQYQVLLDPQRLQAFQIGLEDVRQALQDANLNVPGGFVQRPGQELIVSGQGRIASLDDIRNTLVATRNGVPVTLSQIAEVRVGAEVKRGDGALGLQPAVIGTVSKAYGADTLLTTDKVEAALHDIEKTLPPGIHLDTQVFRQANFIEAAVHNLTKSLIEGAVIVVAVLFLFLMNWRASVITFLSMPLSFVGGLLVMHAFGIGINSMTLGGLAIAIGEVVDNGIITVENVVHRLRLRRAGGSPQGALALVLDAVSEITNSVVYATLIIILIFLPIFFLGHLAGRIFSPLGVAYIASVTASLVVAVTVVPALCYWLLTSRSEKTMGRAEVAARVAVDEGASSVLGAGPAPGGTHDETAFVRWLKRHFERTLRWALQHVGWVGGVSLLALAAALALLPRFSLSFLPEFKEGNFVIAMTTLPGTSLEESMRLGQRVREDLLRYPQVVSIDQRAGRAELDDDAQGPNFSEFDVRLDFSKNRRQSADELLRRIRADLANVPGAVFNVGQFIAHRMDEVQSGVRSQVAVKIFGDRLTELYQLGQRAQAIVGKIPGVVDLNLEQQINVPQVTIRIDRAAAARYGISVGNIARDIETALNGVTVSSVLEGARSFDLTVRLEKSARDSVQAIQDLPIDAPALATPDTASVGKIPLRLVADVHVEDQPYEIGRENVQRVIVLGFNVQGRGLSDVIHDTRQRLAENLRLPPGYYLEYGGQFESQRQANRTLLSFGALALLGALLLLHKAFGNLRDATIVLFNLPLGMIGGIVALYLAGANLSVAAMIGFITLFGIATRNGIILVSRYRQLRERGLPVEAVVLQGTLDRLVPVLMTAATAALGLLPLLFGSPVGKELELPLAQVVLGGLTSATLLNMVVVPAVYFHLERRREARHARDACNSAAPVLHLPPESSHFQPRD